MSIRLAVRKLEALTPRPSGTRRRVPRGTIMPIPRYGPTSFLHPIQGNDVNKLVATLVESEGGNMSRLMALYDDMRERDARLDAVCRTRVLALTGKEWTLATPHGLEQDSEAIRIVEEMNRIVGLLPDMTSLIATLMDGALRGYSVVEMEWGQRQGYSVPVEFFWRDPGRFAFDDRMVIHRSDLGDGYPGIPLSDYGPDRFIIHSPSGGRACYVTRRGALRPCLWPSMTKRYGLRWWLVAAERFGQPAPILKVPDGDDNLFDDAVDMLRNLNEDWQAVLTQGMELELLPGSGDFSGDLHDKMVQLANTEMAVCILGQNLSTEVQGGSFAAAKVHDSVRLDYLSADANELSETLRRDLLEPIVRYNFGDVPVPRFDFSLVPSETADVQEWHIIQGVVSINETREALGFAANVAPDAGALRTAPQPEPGARAIEEPISMPSPEVVETEAWIPANLITLSEDDWRIVGTPEDAIQTATAELDPWGRWVMGELTSKLRRAGTAEWKQRVALDTWANEINKPGGPDFERVIYQLCMMGDMAGRLTVAGLELGSDKLIDLRDMVQLGIGDRIAEFFKARFDAAVEFFQRKRVVEPWVFDAMENRWREGAFVARRLANDRLVERARQIVAVGMDQKLTVNELTQRLESGLGLGSGDPAERRNWYAETISRTNLGSAYGAGRYQQMTTPAVRAGRPFVEYRTIGDSRVRDPHRALDRLVFVNGSNLSDQYAPPLGFNCRCQMVTLGRRQFERSGKELTRDLVIVDGAPYLGDKGFTEPAPRAPADTPT